MAGLVGDGTLYFRPGDGHLGTLDAASDALSMILEQLDAADGPQDPDTS